MCRIMAPESTTREVMASAEFFDRKADCHETRRSDDNCPMSEPMTPHLGSRLGLVAFLVGSVVTLATKPSRAEQFTLFDETFEFTWEDAINSTPSKSHHYVKGNALNAQRPTNWVSPVDYRNGKVHIHLEVLEKPEGGQKQGWALCYVGGGSYGCPYTKYYTEPGVYDNEVDMTSFYNNSTIDWTKGITEVDLIYTINDSGMGHVHYFPELKDKTTPTKVRIAMVQLSKGATYDPSQLPGGNGTGGAGGSGGSAGGGGGSAGNASGGGGSGGGSSGAAGMSSGGGGAGGSGPAPGGSGGVGGSVPSSAGTSVGGGGGGGVAGSGGTTTVAGTDQESGCNFGHSSSAGLGTVWALAALGLLTRSRRRS